MSFAVNIQHSEEEFISACVRKEKWAQQLLYEEYYGILMGVCLRYSKDSEEAMDILHEGYIKVFRHIGKYKPGTSLTAWMRRIMVNTAIDFYRRKNRKRTDNIEEAYDLQSSGADAVSQLSAKEILKAVQQLSPAYRTVFNMYVIEGFSHKEIAKKLGISESTSRSNLVKARSKLRQLLTSFQFSHER